jgi:NitT/TauT family transport system ATP-binding protein
MAPRPGRVDTVYPVPLALERSQPMKHQTVFLELKLALLERIRSTSGMKTDLDLLQKLSRTSAQD